MSDRPAPLTGLVGRLSILALLALSTLAATASPAAAQALFRVPQDGDLQRAINRVADGGVIEIAPGVYPAPGGGFSIRDERKGFTVRAAGGGAVVLDGGGGTEILRFENSQRDRGGRVVFVGLVFRDGLVTLEGRGGGVTVERAEAAFVDCVFRDNRTATPTTGGGGLAIGGGSFVEVVGGAFRGNSSNNRGGAIAVRGGSFLSVRGTAFDANRVNLPIHAINSAGGAIYVEDARAVIAESLFTGNQSGFAGGAIHVFGIFRDPLSTPSAEVRIVDSTFLDNRVAPAPCCPPPGSTAGGAVHVEDHATVFVHGSRFERNRATFGGGLDLFRAIVEVEDSIFRDNRAEEPGSPLGVGSAIAVLSSDTPADAVNRRPGSLVVRRSLLQGRIDGGVAAASAGCLFTSGDTSRLDGVGGVPAEGSPAKNRATVEFDEVVFADCRAGGGLGPSFGGGANAVLTDLEIDDSLFLDSAVTTSPGGGGGLALIRETAARIDATAFAGNAADSLGGGVLVNGSSFEIDDSLFVENEVSPGEAEPVNRSQGAALLAQAPQTAPGPGRSGDVTGGVADSVFAGNLGLEIRDIEPVGGARNDAQYDANRFFSTSFGALVYGHNTAAPNGLAVAGLNALTIPRPGADLPKSVRANVQLFTRPRAGRLVVVPAAGAPGERVGPFAGFAWSGGRAVLDTPATAAGAAGTVRPTPRDQDLGANRHDVVPVGPAGRYALRVDGVEVAADVLAAGAVPPLPAGPFLSSPAVPDFRFKVEIVGGGRTIAGTQEPRCIPETVCVSGALPGRSEVFMRVPGPKPNGFLQPTLVKFSTSRVRIWVEQISTGELEFYQLDAVVGGGQVINRLDGRVDRTGFLPSPAIAAPAAGSWTTDAIEAITAANGDPPRPPGGRITSPDFPDFSFTVRISTAQSERLGVRERDCIEETVCVSGAVPGRSEVFLRVVGPKANGFLQPTIVTFSTSTIEVWIEQLSTGTLRYYRLPGVSPGDESLDGLIDREGFLP